MLMPRYDPPVIWTPEEIKRRRDAKGWTQQQLANALGASRRAVIGWEAGTSVPQGRFIGQMERVLAPEGPTDPDAIAAEGPLLRDADFAQTINHLIDLYNDAVRDRVHDVFTVEDGALPATMAEGHDVVQGPELRVASDSDDDADRTGVDESAEA